jgi:putative PIN family toxin of toxin-antitoxin system
MRSVLDTNVFISSFYGGNPRKIISLWAKGDMTICLSAAILDEYTAEFGELLDFIGRGHNIVFAAETPRISVVGADPADDKFIECAVALKAEVIVTGDKALRKIGEYAGIRILTPAEFLKSR